MVINPIASKGAQRKIAQKNKTQTAFGSQFSIDPLKTVAIEHLLARFAPYASTVSFSGSATNYKSFSI